ncbi:MAG: response regulator transcription factor [Oscillospiraceae bacterium]|nr:response regulator transcription factor [Oscillospiraceae bacterium]
MIYMLEDDSSIRELVIYALRASVYEAEGYEDAAPFWRAVSETLPQMILLDIMLPGEDGISVLKKLKANPRTADIPVIMATAKGAEYDKVLGLDLGADDYIAKPFGVMELLSRVRAVLRRAAPHAATTADTALCYRDLTLDAAAHRVTANGKNISLTLKEFQLLRLLLTHAGSVVGREQLLNEIWGYGYDGETRTVDVHIGTLRQKLGSCGAYIETVRGVGYKIG